MASTSTNVTTRVDIELDKPFHPPTTFRFPTRSYGLRNRSCQHSWFTEFSFLHYDIELDAVFCHTCQKTIREKKIRSSARSDQAFVSLLLSINRFINQHCIAAFNWIFKLERWTGKN